MQKKVLPILFGTLLLDITGLGMIIPIIPILFTDPSSPSFMLTGYSVSGQLLVAGLVTALAGIMQFFAAPILGELSDVYGRKRLLTVGVGVLAISQLFFGLGIQLVSLPIIFLSRAIAGIATGNLSIAQASIADITPPAERAKNFGLIGAAFGIGLILGPLLGGWIVHITHSAASPFWLAGMLGVFNLVFITLLLPETNTSRRAAQHFTLLKGVRNIKSAINDVDARPVYSASFLYMSGFTFLTSFVGVFLVSRHGFSAAAVGTFFGIMGAWVVVTQGFILRWLTKIYKERTILRVSILTMAAAMATFPFLPGPHWLYALVPVLAISQGLTMANMNALISKSVSGDRQGAALGINSSLIALAQGVIPIVAGIGSGFVGLNLPFVGGAVLMVAAWTMLFTVRRNKTTIDSRAN